jgi:hypothetical protein
MAEDALRQRRSRNLALAGLLVAFVALIFVITIVRLSLLP